MKEVEHDAVIGTLGSARAFGIERIVHLSVFDVARTSSDVMAGLSQGRRSPSNSG